MSILPKTVQEFFNTHDGELRRHVGVREKGGACWEGRPLEYFHPLGGLGLPALDRKLVALAAADAPDARRDPRHRLRRAARTSRPWLRCPCT